MSAVRGPTAKEIAARARAELVQHRKEVRDIVGHLDALIKNEAHLVGLDTNAIRQKRAGLQEHVARITEQINTRSWLYVGILHAAVTAGIDLRNYTVPPPGQGNFCP